MGLEQEAAVRGFFEEMEGEELEATQVERVVSRMAPNARWHVVAWRDPFVGHDAIKTEFDRQSKVYRGLQIEVLAIASAGGVVFTERIDSLILRGKPMRFHVVGVLEVDADGAITAWRDYLDSREVSAIQTD